MIAVLFALGVFALDRLSKRSARRLGTRVVVLGPIARILCHRSHRPGSGRWTERTTLVLLWCAALVCAIVLHRAGGRFRGDAAMSGLGAAFGGAAGNLIDLLRREPIVDFIDLRWWPVFNLADVAIVAGLLVGFLVPS